APHKTPTNSTQLHLLILRLLSCCLLLLLVACASTGGSSTNSTPRTPTPSPTATPTFTPTPSGPMISTPLVTYKGHSGPVIGVAWSPDGTQLASCGNDGTVQVWNAKNGQMIWKVSIAR